MERRAVFVLPIMLYLAGTLDIVQAVTYSGARVVHEGQPWSIECQGLKSNDPIRWTRNGQSLEPELASGQLIVLSKLGGGSSNLSALIATENHEGDYKCTPNSDVFHLSIQVDVKIKILTENTAPLILECTNKTSNDKLQWLKERNPVYSVLSGKENVIRIDNETGTLEILKQAEEAYGNYTCKVGNLTTEYRIVPKPTAHLVNSINVVEGEKLHLVCTGNHNPGIKFSWTYADQNYTSSVGRVKIEKDEERGIYGAILKVDNVEMTDRGDIYCRVSYNWSDPAEENFAEAQTFLRVKDKLAALWPFLGIVAEVLVLCAIILVYEKKRNKAELDESDTDQSPDTKPTPNKDSDVRHRK